MTQKILIVGIGVMGAPMAKNIINAGFDVAVCDVSSDACLLYTSPSPRDVEESRMPSSA